MIIEYKLILSTNEEISVSELDSEFFPLLTQDGVRLALSSVFSLCTYASRDVMEKAKRRDTKPLERLLKTPPYGCLRKLDKPVCRKINDCVMANRTVCTVRNIKKNLGIFPECFQYDASSDETSDYATTIINIWKSGNYAIIIT
jgi:hypothetical protein